MLNIFKPRDVVCKFFHQYLSTKIPFPTAEYYWKFHWKNRKDCAKKQSKRIHHHQSCDGWSTTRLGPAGDRRNRIDIDVGVYWSQLAGFSNSLSIPRATVNDICDSPIGSMELGNNGKNISGPPKLDKWCWATHLSF